LVFNVKDSLNVDTPVVSAYRKGRNDEFGVTLDLVAKTESKGCRIVYTNV